MNHVRYEFGSTIAIWTLKMCIDAHPHQWHQHHCTGAEEPIAGVLAVAGVRIILSALEADACGGLRKKKK